MQLNNRNAKLPHVDMCCTAISYIVETANVSYLVQCDILYKASRLMAVQCHTDVC